MVHSSLKIYHRYKTSQYFLGHPILTVGILNLKRSKIENVTSLLVAAFLKAAL